MLVSVMWLVVWEGLFGVIGFLFIFVVRLVFRIVLFVVVVL